MNNSGYSWREFYDIHPAAEFYHEFSGKEQLRELAEADPFKPLVIVTLSGNKLRVGSAKDIEFTHYGSPKIWVPDDNKTFGKLKPGHWRILNADAIAEIIV